MSILGFIFGDLESLIIGITCILSIYILIPIIKYLIARYYYKCDKQTIIFSENGYEVKFGNIVIKINIEEIKNIKIKKSYIKINNKKTQNRYITQDLKEISDYLNNSNYSKYIAK